jgi:hypothetical protein
MLAHGMFRLQGDVDQYPYRIRLRQLQEIARSPRNGGEDIVQAYYSWRDARAMTVSKGLAGAALALLTAWFVPFLKNEYFTPGVHRNIALTYGPIGRRQATT